MKKFLDNLFFGASCALICATLWLFGYMTIGLPGDRPQDTAYGVESPCYWQGSVAKCLPSSGIYLDNSKVLRLGTDDTTHYVELAAPTGMVSNWILTFPSALSGAGKVLYDQLGDGALSWHDAGITASDLATAVERIASKPTADLVCHSNITLSDIQTCDGQSTTGAVRVLVMGQTDPTQNGEYSNQDIGAWVRYPNMSSLADLPGSLVTVTEQGGGTSYQDTLWFGTGDGGSTANFRLIPTTASNTQLTASSAVATDSNSHLAASSTTATELGYVHNVTSAIQTQLNAKQASDATLTALAAYNTNGLLTQTAADTFTGRTLTGTTNRLTVTNGDGVSGNPTADISSSYVGQSTITTLGTITSGTWTGTTVAVANGGTGITSFGTGIATWLGTPSSANLRGALTDETGTGLAYFQGGDIGTPSAGVLTNATGLPIASGVSNLGTGVATFLTTPSSANAAAMVTDETGTGALVFGSTPTLNQPVEVGLTTDTAASAGNYGEIKSNVASSTNWGTSAVATDVTSASVSLGAGVWIVDGSVTFNCSTVTGTTFLQSIINCSGTGVSAALGAEGKGTVGAPATFCNTEQFNVPTGVRLLTVSSGNTATCKLQMIIDYATNSGGTATTNSFIRGRRYR